MYTPLHIKLFSLCIPALIVFFFNSNIYCTKPTPNELETCMDYLENQNWDGLKDFFKDRDKEFITTPFSSAIFDDDNADRTLTFLHLFASITKKKFFPQVLVLCKLLIEKGAQINMLDSDKRTALHWALIAKNESLFKELVSQGADPKSAFESLETGARPWFWKLLLETKGQNSILYEFAQNPLVESNWHEFLISECNDPTILNSQDDNGNTMLHLVCQNKLYYTIPALVKKGALPCVFNKQGESPLHKLVQNKDCDFRIEEELVSEFLSYYKEKPVLNAKNLDGDSVLDLALKRYPDFGYDGFASTLLLEYGANPFKNDFFDKNDYELMVKKPVSAQCFFEKVFMLDYQKIPKEFSRLLAGYTLFALTNAKRNVNLLLFQIEDDPTSQYQPALEEALTEYLGDKRWTEEGITFKTEIERFVVNILNTRFGSEKIRKVPWSFAYPAGLEAYFKPAKSFNNNQLYYKNHSNAALNFYRNLWLLQKMPQKNNMVDKKDITIIFSQKSCNYSKKLLSQAQK